jgi:hypothetical protein
MKKSIILLVLFTVALIFSCKDSREKDSTNEYINDPSHVEDAAVNIPNQDMKSTDYTMRNDSLVKMDKEDLTKMYTHLGMKDEQIQSFEAKDSKYVSTETVGDNPIDVEDLWEQRDENLKEVLTDAQYEQYLMWKKDMNRKSSVETTE